MQESSSNKKVRFTEGGPDTEPCWENMSQQEETYYKAYADDVSTPYFLNLTIIHCEF